MALDLIYVVRGRESLFSKLTTIVLSCLCRPMGMEGEHIIKVQERV